MAPVTRNWPLVAAIVPPASEADAAGQRRLDQRAGRVLTDVDDGDDRRALRVEVERRAIGPVMGGGHQHPLADLDAVSIEKDAGGVGQHHAGPVVAGKHQRPLDGAGGEHDVPGPHLPHPLARRARRGDGEMIGSARSQRGDEIVAVVAEGLGARQQRDMRHRRERRERRGDPFGGGPAADRERGFGEQRAAEFGAGRRTG